MSRFADTSYFLALLIPNDENHATAVALADQWRGELVTTDFVIIETGNHLSPQRSRGAFARFFRAISMESRINIVPSSRLWIERGLALYESRPDKTGRQPIAFLWRSCASITSPTCSPQTTILPRQASTFS